MNVLRAGLSSWTERQEFLTRLYAAAPPGEARRRDRVISNARLGFAVVSLIAIYLDPTEPPRYAEIVNGLLILYVVYSASVLAFVYSRPAVVPRARIGFHIADVFWLSILTTLTHGPNSPFFVFIQFVLLVAAYQWGLWETLLTGLSFATILCFQVILLILGPSLRGFAPEGEFELNRFIMRSTYLLLMGLLLGYLSEQEKQQRAETAVIAGLLGRVQAEHGLRATLQAVFSEVMRLFEVRQALLVLREEDSERLYLWQARSSLADDEVILHFSDLEFAQHQTYFFETSAHTMLAVRRDPLKSGGVFDLLGLDAKGQRLPRVELSLPPLLLAAHAFSSLLAVNLDLAREWRARLLVFDPKIGAAPETELRFLQKLLREVGPAVHSVYLVRRLRSRVGAVERGRVARELHDGAIQSLVALEMHMDVLRRPGAFEPGVLGEKLTEIQQRIHEEVLKLRDLMEQVKPMDVSPREVLEHITALVEKFQRETGVAASFVSQFEEVTLPARAAREISRIVQESLVNIRKHSAARNVRIHFGAQDGCWVLRIEDDGRGFDFSGRLSLDELDAGHKGPVVIKERIRSLGGQLTIESNPGHGACLEVSIPQRSHA